MRKRVLCQMRTTKVQISAFVVHCLDSVTCMSLVSVTKISRLMLASLAEPAGLSLTWSETPKTGFLVTRLILFTSCVK